MTMSMTTCTLSPATPTVVDRGVAGRERRVVMQHVAVLDQVVVVIVRVPPVCHTSVDAMRLPWYNVNYIALSRESRILGRSSCWWFICLGHAHAKLRSRWLPVAKHSGLPPSSTDGTWVSGSQKVSILFVSNGACGSGSSSRRQAEVDDPDHQRS